VFSVSHRNQDVLALEKNLSRSCTNLGNCYPSKWNNTYSPVNTKELQTVTKKMARLHLKLSVEL
jgi:hypothetical protein